MPRDKGSTFLSLPTDGYLDEQRSTISDTEPLQGRDAIVKAGMQWAMAEMHRQDTQDRKSLISYRCGKNPTQRFNDRSSPKPGYVKDKSSNNPFIEGSIAIDKEFARSDGEKIVGFTEYSPDEFEEYKSHYGLAEVQAEINVADLLRGMESTPPTIEHRGSQKTRGKVYEVFSSTGFPKTDVMICLSDFENGAPRKLSNAKLGEAPTMRRPSHVPTSPVPPTDNSTIEERLQLIASKLTNEHNSNTEGLDVAFPLYKTDGSALEVLGVRQDNGEVLPITGDWDQLLMGFDNELIHAVKISNGFKPSFFEVQHTKGTKDPDSKTQTSLTRAYAMLTLHSTAIFNILKEQGGMLPEGVSRFEDLLKKPDGAVDTSLVQLAGSITPMEFVMGQVINYRMNQQLQNLKNPIQHGPENRSPLDPSDLDGNILHFYEGKSIMTRTEDQLVEFMMGELKVNDELMLDSKPVDNSYFDVHPRWDMSKWGRVVIAQVENKYNVPKDTLENCLKYYQDQQKKDPRNKELQGAVSKLEKAITQASTWDRAFKDLTNVKIDERILPEISPVQKGFRGNALKAARPSTPRTEHHLNPAPPRTPKTPGGFRTGRNISSPHTGTLELGIMGQSAVLDGRKTPRLPPVKR